jgi:hypothetical protein
MRLGFFPPDGRKGSMPVAAIPCLARLQSLAFGNNGQRNGQHNIANNK